MKRTLYLFIIPFLLIFVFFVPISSAQTTATIQLSLQPETSTVNVGDTKVITIKLKTSSSTKRVSTVRSILQFNPNILEITNVSTTSLFCQYPTDSSSYASDNSQGVLMITGFATGGASCTFPELSTTEVSFATVTFRAKASGNSDLDFIFTGENSSQVSVALDTNSPPQMVLQSATDGDMTVATTGGGTTIPDDLGINETLTIFGVIGVLAGGIFIFSQRPKKLEKRVRIITAD